MTVAPSDIIAYRGKDGATRTGRVTATMGPLVLVRPDGGCTERGCTRQPGLEQITEEDIVHEDAIVQVNRALLLPDEEEVAS